MRHSQEYARTYASRFAMGALVVFLFLLNALAEVKPALANDAQDARQLVEKARLTFESVQADPQMGPDLRALVHRAKGVMIFPQVLRGAFLFGASGGSGVFLTRHQESDTWAGPAFYSFGGRALVCKRGARPQRWCS